MNKRVILWFFIVTTCFSIMCNSASATETGYTISASSAIIGQEYVLIIVGGERNELELIDNDDSIVYIQQKAAINSTITFTNVNPSVFETATAFIISENGVLVKCEVLENSSANTINLPSAVKEIEEEAFVGIPASVVKIPDGLTTIRKRAFASSQNLREIYIPASVITIEENVFQNSPNVVIYGYNGSEAEEYARQYGIQFVGLD